MVRGIASIFRYMVNVVFILALIAVVLYVIEMWDLYTYDRQTLILQGVGSLLGVILVFGTIYVLLDISLTLHAIERQNRGEFSPQHYGQPMAYQQPVPQGRPQMAPPQMMPPQQQYQPRQPHMQPQAHPQGQPYQNR